jgi:hypothetical protein
MRIHLLPTITLAVGLAAAGAAFAQDQPAGKSAPPGVDPAHQNAPQPGSKPEQGGKQEPGSRAATTQPEQSPVLVDGKLNVPGAPENSDAVPAKFSAKNDADDQMITAGYTFKLLTPEQKKAIYQVVSAGGAQTANSDLPAKIAVVGATLPPLYPLTTFPALTTRQVDQAAKYHYTVVGDQLLLVEPNNMIVVGVIGPEAAK